MTNCDRPIDVNQLPEDVCCPLCGYSLRGTTEARCPECGYEFDWRDLLDPDRRRHLYLFEQQPRRNVLSFFRTLAAGFRPLRFWSGLLPSHQIRPRRLVFYALVTQLFCITGGMMLVVDDVLYYKGWQDRQREAMVVNFQHLSPGAVEKQLADWNSHWPDEHFESVEEFAEFIVPGMMSKRSIERFARKKEFNQLAMLLLLPLLWLPLTYLFLRLFRWSMRSRKIVGWQVFRCVVYSADALFWLSILFWSVGLNQLRIHFFPPDSVTTGGIDVIDLAWILSPVLLLHMIWRLYRAYQKYLRFPHAAATVVTSQIMFLLVISTVMMIYSWVTSFQIVRVE